MDKQEIKETLAEANALDLPQGLLVRSFDGRSFFLTEEEIKHKAQEAEVDVSVTTLFEKAGGGGVPATADTSCSGMLNWLLTHNPNTKRWRKNSVIWMNNC